MNAQIHDFREFASRTGRRPATGAAPSVRASVHYAVGPCSLGRLLVAETAKGVCAILIGDNDSALTTELRSHFPHTELVASGEMQETLTAAVQLIERPQSKPSFAIDAQGTSFQKRVWQALRNIPAGVTATYAEIAKLIGSPGSARPVAQACASNPVAVAIPCHRVVRSDGSLSGYRWGVARKKALLERENAK